MKWLDYLSFIVFLMGYTWVCTEDFKSEIRILEGICEQEGGQWISKENEFYCLKTDH